MKESFSFDSRSYALRSDDLVKGRKAEFTRSFAILSPLRIVKHKNENDLWFEIRRLAALLPDLEFYAGAVNE